MVMAGKSPPKRASDQVKDQVAQYVSARLKEECKERGDAAKIAAKIKFTDAAVSNAKNHGIMGQKLARALAGYWGMTIDQLEAVALGRGEAPEVETPKPPSSVVVKDPPDASELRRLGDVPGWDEAVEEAIQIFGDSLGRDDYAAAASLRGLELPERVDAAAAAHWAKTCAWQRARNERMKKEMAEAAAELAAWRKAQGQ